jgi:hypothetical protein
MNTKIVEALEQASQPSFWQEAAEINHHIHSMKARRTVQLKILAYLTELSATHTSEDEQVELQYGIDESLQNLTHGQEFLRSKEIMLCKLKARYEQACRELPHLPRVEQVIRGTDQDEPPTLAEVNQLRALAEQVHQELVALGAMATVS